MWKLIEKDGNLYVENGKRSEWVSNMTLKPKFMVRNKDTNDLYYIYNMYVKHKKDEDPMVSEVCFPEEAFSNFRIFKKCVSKRSSGIILPWQGLLPQLYEKYVLGAKFAPTRSFDSNHRGRFFFGFSEEESVKESHLQRTSLGIEQSGLSEKVVQGKIEANLYARLKIRLVKSEFDIVHGKKRMRIDTLGIDTEGNPVVIEYKRDKSKTIINQGIMYLNGICSNKRYVENQIHGVLGHHIQINWNNPRLICIANDFHEYDTSVAKSTIYNVGLIRYKLSNEGSIILEDYWNMHTLS